MEYDPDQDGDEQAYGGRTVRTPDDRMLPDRFHKRYEDVVIDFLRHASPGEKPTIGATDSFGGEPTISTEEIPAAWLADRLPLDEISADELAVVPEYYADVDGAERSGPVLTAAFNMLDDDELIYDAPPDTTVSCLGYNLAADKRLVLASDPSRGREAIGKHAQGTIVNQTTVGSDIGYGLDMDATVINYGRTGHGEDDRADLGNRNSGLTINLGEVTGAIGRHQTGVVINYEDEPFYGYTRGLYINIGQPNEYHADETRTIVWGKRDDRITLSQDQVDELPEVAAALEELQDVIDPAKSYDQLLEDIGTRWDDPAAEIKEDLRDALERAG